MNKIGKTAWISIVINLILLLVLGISFIKFGGLGYVSAMINKNDHLFNENPYYIERTTLFKGLDIPQHSIIFLGDSITYRAEWAELFPEKSVINRGIGSDTTEGVLNRLDEIVASKPEKIFIMIGVNDIGYGVKISDAVQNYDKILSNINGKSPNTEVFVQSVLPISNELFGNNIDVQDIINLNGRLEYLSKKHKTTYIDLYSVFAKDGQLDKNLTLDGVHLKGEGYIMWKEAIKDYVNN